MLESISQYYTDFMMDLTLLQTYLLIFILVVIVYKSAFAVAMPLLKSLLVYFSLFIGSGLILLFHAMNLPVIPVMLCTILLVLVTRIRLWLFRKKPVG